MTEPIERSRNSCALHGVIQTIQEIEGVVPIIHSTAGCGIGQYLGSNRSSGCGGSGYTGGFALSSSNVFEKQVIFGGTSRLREQIKNTVKVLDGDLYVAVSGCAPELVGDDLSSMVKESQEQGYPIIYIKSPGFKGEIHFGYESALKSIIEELPEVIEVETKKHKGLVNILGVIPKQNIHWKGNLEEIKRILEELGLKVNTLVGFKQNTSKLKKLPSAELNIVFSPWGLSAAEKLKEKYGIPFIYFDSIPVGDEDTINFLQEVGKKLGLDLEKIDEYARREEKEFYYHIDNLLDFYYDYNFQKNIALVGEESTILGVSRFLVKTFGFIPKIIIITDPLEETYKKYVTHRLTELLTEAKTQIYFTADSGKIDEVLKENIPELILGSSLENSVAEELDIPIQVISYPSVDNVILNKSYVGFKGAITLLEDLSSTIVRYEKYKNKQIRNEIKDMSGLKLDI